MDELELARQLRTPTGDTGREVAGMMNKSNALMYEQAIQQLGEFDGETILEIGMGNGAFCTDILAAAPTARYTGCDISEVMVEEAGRINRHLVETGQARFLHTPADRLPFAEKSFDNILTLNTIYFWDQPQKELAELRRVLKPTGRFTLALRSKDSMEKHPFAWHGFTLYNREDLVPVVEAGGFYLVRSFSEWEPPREFDGKLVVMENIILTFGRKGQ